MPKRKSDYDIGAEWMHDGKMCVLPYEIGRQCILMEHRKECQKCVAEYRKEENAKSK